MPRKPSLLCVASQTQGRCRDCRHANQGTRDFAEGLVLCAWDHGSRRLDTPCDVKLELPRRAGGERVAGYYLFERYDGANGAWLFRGDRRMLAADADASQRALMQADQPLLP